MDEVIEQVGLPVKCRLCSEHGRVKPRTNYDGWQKRKTVAGITWYCPKHPGAVDRLAHVPLGNMHDTKPSDTLDELMNLI